MTPPRIWTLPRSSIFELLLLTGILAGFGHVLWHLAVHRYLPQPFVWDPQDTFMDWFNPAYWAHRDGIYSVWRAVYPPLSFAFLELASTPECYVTSSFSGRDCDIFSQIVIILVYLLAMAVSFFALRKAAPRVAIFRILALAFGLPGLYVLERGNLLIICQLCLAAMIIPGAGNRWVKAISAAVMINLKPYLLLVALSWAVKRQWRVLELAGFATVGLYLLSWALVGSGSPLEIAANSANWVKVTGTDVVGEMFYTTSFNSMFGIFDRGFPILRYVASRDYDIFRFWVNAILLLSQAAAIAALALAYLRPATVPLARIAVLLLLVFLTGRSPGGYSELLVVFLVFLETWRGFAVIVAIVVAYLISIPAEWIVSYLPNVHTGAWLTGEAVTARFGIGVGQFLRPIGLLVIEFALACDTIFRVTRALRAEISAGARPKWLHVA